MHRYLVTDLLDDGRAIALFDCAGKHHLARAVVRAPTVGAELDGGLPALGFGVLVAVESHQLFRVVFELIDCDRQATLERRRDRRLP